MKHRGQKQCLKPVKWWVTDGPFNDFNGTVEEVNYEEKSKLRVAVNIWTILHQWARFYSG